MKIILTFKYINNETRQVVNAMNEMKELTAMQAACWMGRSAHAHLGGVSAHLYAEFDGPALDLVRLHGALERLYQAHPMLRLTVTRDGAQTLRDPAPAMLEIDDFRFLSGQPLADALARKRQEWTHQQLDLSRGQAARFSVTRLADQRQRLHIDTDMMAIDPSSVRILLADLAQWYEEPEWTPPPSPSFFAWHEAVQTSLRARREQDRQWWRQQLPTLAPAPTLPTVPQPTPPASERLSATLDAATCQALTTLARQRRLTLSSLMLGLFTHALGKATGDRRFRLNVPFFWREPVLGNEQRIVGEFANLTLVDVDLDQAGTLDALCRQLAAQWHQRLGHGAYSGVAVMRDLSRHHGSAQLAPIVFTAALDLEGGSLFDERVHRVFGAMNWVISQGPQVALDAQLVRLRGELLINWDVRLDALPLPWITALFDDLVAQLRQLARDPALLDAQLHRRREAPLTPLQQAYLLGRTTQFPLGGVAMQEYREYRGKMEPVLLRARLREMVQRHDALRTRIDADRLVQVVDDEVRLNLHEQDLRQLTEEEVAPRLARHREAYSHALFDLTQSPWDLTLLHLPGDELVAFVRIDALILDGHAIATLMRELFEGIVAPALPSPPAHEPTAAQREQAGDYWRRKLARLEGPPRLPWTQPLEGLRRARYARQRQRIPAGQAAALYKLGARQHLFKNTTLMAVILEVLSRWRDEGDLCVAVPVAPPPGGPLTNRSSFIALTWQPAEGTLLERAHILQQDVMEGLDRLAFSGVDIARQLVETHGGGPALPVVITNGLAWPVAASESPMQWQGGLTQTPQVAMDIRISQQADGTLVLDIDYASEALEAALVSDLLAAMARAVARLAEGKAFHLPDLVTPTHARHNSLPDAACHTDFLQRIADRLFHPQHEAVALIQGERQLSYRELGHGVGHVMHALSEAGIKAGQVVAICLPRSPEHTMVTLACALSGIIWVPVDAASPAERRRYLLDNCCPDLVVAEPGAETGHPTLTPATLLAGSDAPLGTPWAGRSAHTTPAYYLYTSGTTGRPKCVMLSNQATANVIGSTLQRWGITEQDRFLSVTPLHHDMSVFDVFGCLTAGATLVLPEPGADKDAVHWGRLIARHGVTLWCSVPAMLEMLLACHPVDTLQSLRLIAQGGDYIKPGIIERLRTGLPATRLFSLGGPTETTIWSIWHEISADDRQRIPYGTPLPGNAYWLLDERGEHCPLGVAGRIHTSGVNLALGYLEQGQLVQTDFVTLTDDKGQPVRAFRTGDRGRYRRDGTLLFDSRVNGYIKVRGVRVSLPDVESALITHPALAQVLVVEYGDEQQGELGIGLLYVCATGHRLDPAALREFARARLPASHVPTRALAVEQLPLTANGKPDKPAARTLLAQPAPRHGVLDIYLEVLGAAPGSADSRQPFTALGLRPQHLKTISARLRERFAVELSPGQLLACRTAADVEGLLASVHA